jgi:hypothetical protein
VDPTKGYRKWNGTTLTLIDATKLGCALAVFQGRVWIAAPNSRTLIFTAPATNNDFTSGNGAGSTVITDEAFPGIIVALASALEQLWVLGEGGIEAVSNVQASGTAPSIVTTFSITNVVAGLGTSEPGSQVGYFRALTFMAPYGVYALSGVTPQKLSDKLDGLFPGLTLGHAYVAVVVVQTLPVLMFLVQYTPTAVPGLPTPGSNSLAVAPLLLCFTQGKWFTASQGAPVAITSLLVDGVAQGWASRGTDVYRLFGADLETPVVYKVQSKLYDFGASTTRTQMMRFGFEYQAESIIAPDFTIDSEAGQEAVDVVGMGNALTLINDGGDTLTLVNDVFAVLTFIVSTGMILSRTRSNSYGRYLGFTLRGEDPPYRAQAFQMQTALAAEWDTP